MPDSVPTRVSIAMCTCNGDRWLEAQLASLREQTRQPDELVICDDASTDATVEIAERFAREVTFPVQVHRHPQRLGVVANFSEAIRRCTGEVIFLADQDDVWLPAKIERFVTVFEQRPEVGLVAGHSLVCDQQLQSLGYTIADAQRYPSRWRRRLADGRAFDVVLHLAPVGGHAMAFRRNALDVVLPIPPIGPHDHWILVLLAALGPVVFLDEPVVHYRQHPVNAVGGQRKSLRWWWTANRAAIGRYQQDVDRYRALVDRLSAHQGRLADADRPLRRAQAKLHFLEQRAALKGRPRVIQPLLVAGHLALGRYHRHGRGWLTAGRDLLV